MTKRTRLGDEEKQDLKKRFRVLPANISIKACHARLVVATGYDIKLRTFQRWIRDEKWERDLHHEVKKETTRLMLKTRIKEGAEQAGKKPEDLEGDEDAQIDAAASATASVLVAHQENIGLGRERWETTAVKLRHQISTDSMVVKDRKGNDVLGHPSVSYALDSLGKATRILTDLVALERQAYGVDDERSAESDDDLLLALAREAEEAEKAEEEATA